MSIRPREGFFFVLQIQFKGARRRGSSRSCRANVAAQGHMSQPCDIKEEQERGTGEGGGAGQKTIQHRHAHKQRIEGGGKVTFNSSNLSCDFLCRSLGLQWIL